MSRTPNSMMPASFRSNTVVHTARGVLRRRLYLCLLAIALLSAIPSACARQTYPTPAPPSAEEQQQWVHARAETVADLYSITQEGRRELHSLDLRQMVADPLYFGTFGYHSWTGFGEAYPMSVAHELGHAYWGAFTIAGRPDLSWEQPAGGEISSGMTQYRRDLMTFMHQPPDRFEPLRDRLRNFPKLCSGDYPPLYHTVEADMMSLTGGDLELVPPILRKYYDRLLEPGPFGDWYQRLHWQAGLSPQDRRIAGAYLYDPYYPLMPQYESVPPLEGASVDSNVRRLIEQEERQRLVDFAQHFPLVTNTEEGSKTVLEWRRYVEEKADLFSRYPDALKKVTEPQARQLGKNLTMLLKARQLSGAARVNATARVLKDRVGFMLWFALSPEELVELEKAGIRPRPSEERSSLDLALELLTGYMKLARETAEAARQDPVLGASKLEATMGTFQGTLGADLDTFFRLLLAWDGEATARALDEASDTFVEKLLETYPAAVYFLARPGLLLDVFGLKDPADVQTLAPALSRLLTYSSGNYALELPVLEEAARRIVASGQNEPGPTMKALADAHYPLAWLLAQQTGPTLEMLGKNLAAATSLVATQNGCYASPAAAIHRLAYYSPGLAARIVLELWRSGDEGIVSEALAHFAFDFYWLDRLPGSPLSAEAFASLAENLAEAQGWPWVEEHSRDAMSRYAALAQTGEYDPYFLSAFALSLEAAATASPSATAAKIIAALAAEARSRQP